MRHAITLHRLHGEKDFKVVTGPEVPIDGQIDAIKQLARSGRVHPTIAAAQVWNSDRGCIKRFKFQSPAEVVSDDQAQADLAAKAAGANASSEPATKPASKSKRSKK